MIVGDYLIAYRHWVNGKCEMSEQIKRFISFEDIKLIMMALSLFAAASVGWFELKNDVEKIQIRDELVAEQTKEQVEAIKELTSAVQELTVSNTQLQERLRFIERHQSR